MASGAHQFWMHVEPWGCMQALMIAVTQQWGMTGFQEHCSKMQHVYQNRANIMHQAAVRVYSISLTCCKHSCSFLSHSGYQRILVLAPGISAPGHGCTADIPMLLAFLQQFYCGGDTISAKCTPSASMPYTTQASLACTAL